MSVVSINSKLGERRVDSTLQKLGVSKFILALEPSLKPILLLAADFEKCIEYLEAGLQSKESALQELKRISDEMSCLLENYEEEDREWALKFMDGTISEIEKYI